MPAGESGAWASRRLLPVRGQWVSAGYKFDFPKAVELALRGNRTTKGAVVRAGVALDSDKVVRLPAGTAVVVEAAEQLPDKKTRYLLVDPVVGWVSRGAVAKAR